MEKKKTPSQTFHKGELQDRSRRVDSGPFMELESNDRWIGTKSEEELLSDLKIYSARLIDNPHSLADRLRVAAIQLRLGRVDEALVHYEGVLRGYVSSGEIFSAIALCERILRIYPELSRIQRILAALYAHAPHGSTDAPSPVTPVGKLDVDEFVLETGVDSETRSIVNRIFSAQQPVDGLRRDLLDSDDLRPTLPHQRAMPDKVLDLSQPKQTQKNSKEDFSDEELVVPLTRIKTRPPTDDPLK